jgi:hypothetical protein
MQKQQRTPLNETALAAVMAKFFPFFETGKLFDFSKFEIPEVVVSDDLTKALTFARRTGKLRGGFENIETLLKKENNGFEALRKRGLLGSHQNVSLFLLVTNDGSDRFYRNCVSICSQSSPRVLPLKLNCTSATLGGTYFGKDVQVKCILSETREVLNRILVALAEGQS